MDYITDPTAQLLAGGLPPLPSPLIGNRGYFSPGNPGITPATRLRYWYVNLLMLEMMNVVLAASPAITPDPANPTQLLQAIQSLIGGTFNGSVNTGTGWFHFSIPTGTVPLIIQGRPVSVVSTTVPSLDQTLPTAFNTGLQGGICTDTGTLGYGYSINPSGSNPLTAFSLTCPLQQIVGSSITLRGAAGGYAIIWGT